MIEKIIDGILDVGWDMYLSVRESKEQADKYPLAGKIVYYLCRSPCNLIKKTIERYSPLRRER